MNVIIGILLGLILTSTSITNNLYAEGGNQVWLTKTKRGIDISCPYGYQYKDETVQSCTKVNEATFNVVLSYNDLYIEEEFFDEKEIMKQAILAVKIIPDVKIIEKKTSSWFGKITADVKYEKDNLKGLQRMTIFNDGTMIVMQYLSKYNGYDVADKTLSSSIKLLEPNQVAEIEKIQTEYAQKSQEIANKKAAEAYKKKLELEQKAKEEKKKAEEKKKIEEAVKKAEELKKKDEKKKRDAENQAKRIEKNVIEYAEQIKDFEIRLSTIQKNPISSRVVQEVHSLEDELSVLKSKYGKFKLEKSTSTEGEVRNLKAAFFVKLTSLEKKQSGNNLSSSVDESENTQIPNKKTTGGRSPYSTKGIMRMDIVCEVPHLNARLYDEMGNPIQNAFVTLYAGGRSDYGMAMLSKTKSDQNGEWVLRLDQYYEALKYNLIIKKVGFDELNYNLDNCKN